MTIELVNKWDVDLEQYGYRNTCKVSCVHARVRDVKQRAEEITKDILDTSWIKNLASVESKCYEARSKKTIEKLVNGILNEVEDTVTQQFGEIMVSHSAKGVLCEHYEHTNIPVAELWKEQMSGNPGFDFHSETKTNFIAFGEAKYRSSGNSYGVAINQIVEFIDDGKDAMELIDLKNFVSSQAIANFDALNLKALVVAFSINGSNYSQIFDNIIRHDNLSRLLESCELYIVGIEVCQ